MIESDRKMQVHASGRRRAARMLEAADALFCASRAAAIVLGAAALCGERRLRGRPGRIVMLRAHDRSGHVSFRELLRLAGVRMVEAGRVDGVESDDVLRALEAPDVQALFLDGSFHPAADEMFPLPHELIFAARERNRPVLVHAENAARATAMLDAGADLVATGVDDAAGILAGSAPAIARCGRLFAGIGAAMVAHRSGVAEALEALGRTTPKRVSPGPVPLGTIVWKAGHDGELAGPVERPVTFPS
ncbi:MAG: hypothetical protein KDF64_16950 [Geminicoccaceae bacterium]|nr:hypothetical protein [Geminicoccaceae bacterium]